MQNAGTPFVTLNEVSNANRVKRLGQLHERWRSAKREQPGISSQSAQRSTSENLFAGTTPARVCQDLKNLPKVAIAHQHTTEKSRMFRWVVRCSRRQSLLTNKTLR